MSGGVLPTSGQPLGRYILERRIASGGMADVYLARQVGAFGFAKNVAVKVLKSAVAGDDDHVRMFLREALVAADFRHPNLVEVYEVAEDAGVLYLAMELVRGVSVSTLMKLLAQKGNSIPVPLAAKIALDALAGLAYAHEAVNAEAKPLRLVHRDVTPQNILLGVDGGVKVVDFGIARAETALGRTQATRIKGKFSYMAPEQWDPSTALDARADLFSLGVVLYEMSTGGGRLFKGTTTPDLFKSAVLDAIPEPSTRVADYPRALADVVMKALERRPDDRWQSARAMHDALSAAMGSLGWAVAPERLARMVNFALDGQTIESRWERLASGEVAIVPEGSAAPEAGPQGDGAERRFEDFDAGEASTGSITAPQPTPLGMRETPVAPAPSEEVTAQAALPPPRSSAVSTAPDVKLRAARWGWVALAGWVAAAAMTVAWGTTRARLTEVETSAHPIVAPAPVTAAPREVPAPLELLADPTLAEDLAAPWGRALETSSEGLRVRVSPGNALDRLLLGVSDVALRAGVAGDADVLRAREQGFDLRSRASEHVVGYDHGVVVVHPSNPLPSLDVGELLGVFAGRYHSFQMLHGARMTPHVVVCGAGAPPRALLDDLFNAHPFGRTTQGVSAGAEVAADEAAAVARVASDPRAVTVVRLAWVTGAVRVVPVRAGAGPGVMAVAPTRETVRSLRYPLARPVVLYTRGAPLGDARALVDVALGPTGQSMVEHAGYVSR